MAIVNALTESQFIQEFNKLQPGAFTCEGLVAIYEHLEEYSEAAGSNVEFDPAAICDEFTEYEDFAALQGDYPDIEDMDHLEAHTLILPVGFGESFIIQVY